MGDRTCGSEEAGMPKPTIFRLADIDWVDERAQPNPAPEEMIAAAEKTGARRKHLARGESGYFSEYTRMPPGFEVPAHSHSHDELFIVLSGGCRLSTDGMDRTLEARDSAALAAGHEYGFVVGEDGIEFMVVRPGAARSKFA
jgi:quercetin dioxygenase-like cupin family protein